MDRQIINYSANEQSLIKTSGTDHYAGNVVRYIEAHFDLGANWSGYDSVRAIWRNKRDAAKVSTVLNSEGVCIVPFEVLTLRGDVCMNLVGSIVENDVLVDRLTTYPICALTVDVPAMVDGSDPASITPSEYEQFVASVRNDANRAEAGATASEASASEASASAEQATLSAQASEASERNASEYAQNAHISATSAENAKEDAESARDEIRNMSATATVDDTVGTPSVEVTASGADTAKIFNFAFHNLKGETGARGEQGPQGEQGPKGDKGDTGEVSYEDLESLLPKDTASGDIISIPDGQSIIPVESLKVTLEPIQDLHGYDKPWAGGAGKNKFDKDSLDSVSDYVEYYNNYYYSAPIILKPNTAYVMSPTSTASLGVSDYYVLYINPDASDPDYFGGGNASFRYPVVAGVPQSITFTTEATGAIRFGVIGYGNPLQVKASALEAFMSINYQIEEGSTASAWTPYSNICPIDGRTEVVTQRTGVNVWDEEWEVGGISTADGQNINSETDRIRSKNYISVLPSTNYFCSGYRSTSGVYAMYFYDADKNYITFAVLQDTSGSFTTPNNCHYARFRNYVAYGTTYNNDISINYPSTDTEYHPYQGITYTTDLGRTVYGGTLDLVSGELVVDRAMVDLGSLDWTYQSGSTRFYSEDIQETVKAPSSNASTIVVLSSIYEYMSLNSLGMSTNNHACAISTTKNLYVKDTAFTDAVQLKAYLSGQQFCYELATPQTIQLSPEEIHLLLGDNTVWSDGQVTMVYSADVARWVEKRLNQLQG